MISVTPTFAELRFVWFCFVWFLEVARFRVLCCMMLGVSFTTLTMALRDRMVVLSVTFTLSLSCVQRTQQSEGFVVPLPAHVQMETTPNPPQTKYN